MRSFGCVTSSCRSRPAGGTLLKPIVLGILFLLAGPRAWTQGQFVFNNRIASVLVAPVYGPEPGSSEIARHGNTMAGTPPGTQTYAGALLDGAGFTAQFFGGATNLAAAELPPLTPRTAFQSGALAGYVVAPANAIVVNGVPEGVRARLQLRCWDNRGGTVTNWSQVLATPGLARGESAPFFSPPLGGTFLLPPNPLGLQSFSLVATSPPAPPQLTIHRTATNTIVVAWSNPSTDFQLQHNTNFPSTNWGLPGESLQTNLATRYIVVDEPVGNRFYRLIKP